MMTGFFVLMSMRAVIHLVLKSAKFLILLEGNLMKFVEKYARLVALLGVVSISTWGMGCANGGSDSAPEKKAEAGSTTGGGEKAASGEKKEEKKEEAKEEKKAE